MDVGRQTIGHPVDVATGVVFAEHEDFPAVNGQVPLTWERRYSTSLLNAPPSPMGLAWAVRYFSTLSRRDGEYHFRTAAGDTHIFRDPEGRLERGELVRDLATCQELRRVGNRYVVRHWQNDSGVIEDYIFEFSEADIWPLAAIDEVSGLGLDMLRDRHGRLTGVRQRLEGRTLAIEYDQRNRIVGLAVVTNNGYQQAMARYEYDSADRLTAAFDARGNAYRYEYYADGRLRRELARDGGVFSFDYDSRGRCVRTSGLDRYDYKSLHYIDSIRMTEVTDSYGGVTRYQHLASGQVTTITDAMGGETKTDYDDLGRIIAETTPEGATTAYEYDEHGNRNKITDAVGNVISLKYNDSHQVVEIQDPNGSTSYRAYDSAGRLTSTQDAMAARWSISYDAAGNPTRVTNPEGRRRAFSYEQGVLVQSTDWNGNVTRIESDSFGRAVRYIGPNNQQISFTFDLLGNPTRVTLPDGNKIEASYDAGSNLTRLVNALGFARQYRYGTCHRLLETIDENGHRLRYVWGTEPDRLLEVRNERGEAYTYHYDVLGRAAKEVSFDGREYTFAYNKDGWCVGAVNGAGETIEIQRDPLGRLIEQKQSDGGFVKVAYDKLGFWTEAANEHSIVAVERDLIGRVLKEKQGEHWVQSQRNLVGNRTQINTSLGHVLDLVLDPNGSVVRMATPAGHAIDFQFDASGRETGRRLPGDITLRQDFDVCGRLVEQKVIRPRFGARAFGAIGGDGDTLIRRSYTRDGRGQPRVLDDSHRGVSEFAYDPGGRLLQVLRTRGSSESFEYDATGNLTRIREQGGANADELLNYGPGNRLESKNDTAYELDPQGRFVKKIVRTPGREPEVWVYAWDALDQLRAVTRPDGSVWQYQYDALGRRIEKKGPDGSLRFIWDGDVIVHEVAVEQERANSWVFSDLDLTPVAKIEGDFVYSVIPDHLGTPCELLDDRGAVVWRRVSRA